ncbi:MAG: hypothetical protein GX841_08380 [Bacteroidales bacterium]|jgi:hypothetical protein|nr:hypothetical protein [Bacteroidales bacterium]
MNSWARAVKKRLKLNKRETTSIIRSRLTLFLTIELMAHDRGFTLRHEAMALEVTAVTSEIGFFIIP